MKFLRNPASLFLPLLAVSFVLTSCKSNSSAPNPAQPAIPTIGSTFVTVSNDGGYLTRETYTVEATTMQHQSDSKVFKLFGVQDNSLTDSSYIAFESDGDYSIYAPSWNEAGWSTLPFASHSPITTSSDQGSGIFINSTAQGNGAGTMFTVNAIPYSTESVTVTEVNVQGSDTIGVTIEHYSFIPQLGLIASHRVDSTINTAGKVDSLVQYSPK